MTFIRILQIATLAVIVTWFALWSCDAEAHPDGQIATFNWTPSTGPVVGYHVEVQTPCQPWYKWADVQGPSVTAVGQPGYTIRLRVQAFDSAGRTGTMSEPSLYFTFPETTQEN
ncbi:MAG: hypothetical protein ACYSUI_21055 [Planctomycetota bacterium]|jgi:hypothetical protein